jgi:hypothetical protein
MVSAAALSSPTCARGRLQRACLDVMREHQRNGELPTSIRFVIYELEHLGAIAKAAPAGQKRTPAQNVSDAFTILREAGLIPWDWLTDETRSLLQWNYAATVIDYVRDRLAEARINPWGDEPPPLNLCKSRSLAGVLRSIAYSYTCPIAATNVQVGGFLRTDVAPLLEEDRRVLYLGDLDHQGGQIEENTRRVLEDVLARDLDWTRVAITRAQVEQRGLAPLVKADRRYTPPRTHQAWETEALGQTTVVALVREALDALLPEPLSSVQVREQEQREHVGRFLDDFEAER